MPPSKPQSAPRSPTSRSARCSISAPAPAACSNCSPARSSAASASIFRSTCWRWRARGSTAPACKHCSVRQGDIYDLALPRDSFDVVIIHQVLHFLDDSARAIREAARVLRPGGRLLVVDFAPHDLEFLREEHAHRRLGFAAETVTQWLEAAGLDMLRQQTLPPGPRGQDRGLALARARSAHRARAAGRARGGLMNAPRASRFAAAGERGAASASRSNSFRRKTAEMEQTLWESINRLAPLKPNFVSVTYGAGGSTRERTHATVKRILAETMLTPAAHLTCVAATCADIDAVIDGYAQAGVRHIVALRGDPPGGIGERYAPHPGGYRNAADLVAGIKRIADIEVSVSAYPEKHPDSPSVAADIDMLKAKVDAGATRAMTQFFFENESLFPLSRPRARQRHRHPDRARHPAGAEFQADQEFRRALRRLGAANGWPSASTASRTIRRPAN